MQFQPFEFKNLKLDRNICVLGNENKQKLVESLFLHLNPCYSKVFVSSNEMVPPIFNEVWNCVSYIKPNELESKCNDFIKDCNHQNHFYPLQRKYLFLYSAKFPDCFVSNDKNVSTIWITESGNTNQFHYSYFDYFFILEKKNLTHSWFLYCFSYFDQMENIFDQKGCIVMDCSSESQKCFYIDSISQLPKNIHKISWDSSQTKNLIPVLSDSHGDIFFDLQKKQIHIPQFDLQSFDAYNTWIIGKTGSGKTLLLKSIVNQLSKKCKKQLMFTLSEDTQLEMKNDTLDVRTHVELNEIFQIANQFAFENDKSHPLLIVLDDYLYDSKNFKPIADFMKKTRELNIYFIVIHQTIEGFPFYIFKNLEFIFLTKFDMKNNQLLYDAFFTPLKDFSVFQSVFKTCTDKFGFMVFSVSTNNIWWFKQQAHKQSLDNLSNSTISNIISSQESENENFPIISSPTHLTLMETNANKNDSSTLDKFEFQKQCIEEYNQKTNLVIQLRDLNIKEWTEFLVENFTLNLYNKLFSENQTFDSSVIKQTNQGCEILQDWITAYKNKCTFK